jgi:uncharacterized membrane protein
MEELLVMYLISGAILIGVSIPLIKGRVAPNAFYGFRIKDTLQDPKTWYATNTYSGKWLLATGLIFTATCILTYYIPEITLEAYALICLAGFAIPMTIGVIFSWRNMKKINSSK